LTKFVSQKSVAQRLFDMMKIVIIFETQKELVIPMRSSNESLEETFLIVQAFAGWSMGTVVIKKKDTK
jgi:hypothetical protein